MIRPMASGLALYEFNQRLIDSVADLMPAVKPQLAYYEQYGESRLPALRQTIQYAQAKAACWSSPTPSAMISAVPQKPMPAPSRHSELGQDTAGQAISRHVRRGRADGQRLSRHRWHPALPRAMPGQWPGHLHPGADFQSIGRRSAGPGPSDGRPVYEAMADKVADWGSFTDRHLRLFLGRRCRWRDLAAAGRKTAPD